MAANIIAIHNAVTALPEFKFSGIAEYSTRATTGRNRMTIVAASGAVTSMSEAHQHLRSIGLGPEQLVIIDTGLDGDLYAAILGNPKVCGDIISRVHLGWKIEFFCTRDGIEEQFIRDLGLTWDAVASLPSTLADDWNDKSRLREIAADNDLSYLFPQFRFVHSEDAAVKRVTEFLEIYEEVVIKRPSWASGMGMVFGSTVDIVQTYIEAHGGIPPGTIVERSLGPNHVPMSILKRFENGTMVDQWVTEQVCPERDGKVGYEGVILGEMPQVTRTDVRWMMEATAPLYEVVLTAYPNLTGIINFDCIRLGEERFVIECNARCTFSSYLQEIRRGLSIGRANLLPTCVLHKVEPTSARDFTSLQRALGPVLLSDPQDAGVIPIVLGCLPQNGYCYLVASAASYAEATSVMNTALERLLA